MIVSFVWPSTNDYGGGVKVMWEMANGLARRGHEVHFVHGPAWPNRIESVDELPPFPFEEGVQHHIVDSLDDPSLPAGDVVFHAWAPPRLGLPAVIVQGFKMVPARWERDSFRAHAPKVCVAGWLLDIGRGFGVREQQLWHVPIGMDHDLFSVTTPLDERRYDVTIHYNVHWQKGWDIGLLVLRELLRRQPTLRTLVYGIYLPPESLPDGVEVLKGLDQSQLVDQVYNASRVFVQTSRHEGFGYTAVEAMACGAALVTTDNGGSRDYAVADETALVVPSEDVDGLVDSVERLLRDDELRVRLATGGTEWVRRFDWDRSAALLEGYLEEYLADPQRFQQPPAEPLENRDTG